MPVIFQQTDLFNRMKGFPTFITDPMRLHISGPQALLHRYGTGSEKTGISLGAYGPGLNTTYPYPGKADDSIIDLTYTKLYADNCEILYYVDLIDNAVSATVPSGADTIAPVATFVNRIRAANTVFKTGNGITRSTALKADVQVDDVVYLGMAGNSLKTYVKDFVPEIIPSSISLASADISNKATQSAATTNAQTGGTLNCVLITSVDGTTYDGLKDGNISETYDITVTTGGSPSVAFMTVLSASGNDNVTTPFHPSAYGAATPIGTRGLIGTWNNTGTSCTGTDFVAGQVWRVTVAQAFTANTGGTAGGSYTGANITPIPPNTNYDTTYILTVTRGGKFTPSQPIANPASAPNVATAATGGSIAASTYYIVVTYKDATSGETLPSSPRSITTTGAASTITVTSPPVNPGSTQWATYVGTSVSGPFYIQTPAIAIGTNKVLTSLTLSGLNPPATNTSLGVFPNTTPAQITVSTTTGIDVSGPSSITMTGSGVTWTLAALSVGTKGVTWLPNGTGLSKGDVFRIPVVASKAGAIQTLVLGHNLPTTPVDMTVATNFDLKLYTKKDGILISPNRVESPPNRNWTATPDDVTVNSGLTASDPRWTDGTKYPVLKGDLYLEYREWIPDNAGTIGLISDPTLLPDLLGVNHPDNPLCFGVYKALQNSNNGIVKYTSVANPDDPASWQVVLDTIDVIENIYQLVPLTTNKEVLALYEDFIKAQSADDVGVYKVVWEQLVLTTNSLVNDASTNYISAGTELTATLKANPSATSQYTYVQVGVSGSAKFVTGTTPVKPGDTFRYLFTTDGFGNISYTEFAVGSVVNDDTLILATGNTIPTNTAQKFEIWHPLSKNEQAADLADQSVALTEKRVRTFWPDLLTDGAITFPGYYGCSMVAGLASAATPHQSLTNCQVVGATSLPRTTSYFNSAQLKTLTNGGVWVLTQDPVSLNIYNRQATTTDTTTINNREEMIVRNIDAIGLAVLNGLAKYVGQTNVTFDVITQIGADVKAIGSYIIQSTQIAQLGSMLSSLEVNELRQHTTLKDHVVLTLTIVAPYPINKFILTIVL